MPATAGHCSAAEGAARPAAGSQATSRRPVKSATRVLRIFELFESWQREAGVMEIARALDIPQSSTSMLLRNLVALGYLQHDAPRQAYAPTPRLGRLGVWIDPALDPQGATLAAMQKIGRATGGTVILGMLAGAMVRYVHVVPATTALRLHLTPGIERPLALSGMGRLFMAAMDREQVRAVVARHNASPQAVPGGVRLAAVARDLADIRRRGWSLSLARITRGAGVVAVPLPRADGEALPASAQVPLALGVGAPLSAVQAQAPVWVALMRQAVAGLAGVAPVRRRPRA